ncbi:MAG: hypothetical protein SVR08_08455 [Spirochaetota bacterium]|nr:hypothetical protein [Spirochaetota bacterium]
MKINNNTIRISGKISISDLLKDFQIGKKISASIVEKIDNRYAILNIAGKRVKAEFLQGVPYGDKVNLVLERKSDQLFIFKIIDNFNNKDYIEQLFRFSVFNQDDFDRNSLFTLSRYLKDGVPNIFNFNSLFLKIYYKEQFVQNDIVNLLNNLIKLGISKENLLFFSTFLSFIKGFNIDYLSSILISLGMDNYIISEYRKYFKDEKLLKEKLNKLLEDVNRLLVQKNEGHEYLEKIIDILLPNDSSNKNNIFEGEIPYYINDEFRAIKYICYDKSFILLIQLTDLGIVEILFKDFSNFIRIDIFCTKETSLMALQNRIDLLYERLRSTINKKFNINLHNSQNIIEKIIEINSFRLLNKTLDFKV